VPPNHLLFKEEATVRNVIFKRKVGNNVASKRHLLSIKILTYEFLKIMRLCSHWRETISVLSSKCPLV